MKKPILPSGFTLVELIVAVSIFMILTTIGFVSYSDFNRRQQIVQSAKNVQLVFREAQKKARVGEKPEGCDSLRGYRVQSAANLLSLNLIGVCVNGSYTVKTVELPHQTQLSAAVDLTFNVLAGGVTLNSGGSLPVNLTVRSISPSNPNEYVFSIDAGGSVGEGQIFVQTQAVSTPTPTAQTGPTPTPVVIPTSTPVSTPLPTPTPTFGPIQQEPGGGGGGGGEIPLPSPGVETM